MTEPMQRRQPTDCPATRPAWDAALAQLRDWDPAWAETCVRMTTNPWTTAFCPASTSSWSASAERRLHQPQSGRHAPPHPRRARRGCDPRRDSVRPQVASRDVDPFLQPRRAHPARGSEGGGRERRRRSRATRRPATRCGRSANGTRHGTRSSSSIRCGPMSSWRLRSRIYKSGFMPPKEIELLSIAFEPPTRTCTRPARAGTSRPR